jgi:hypothetical protein
MSTACDIVWDLVYGKDLVSTFSRLTSWPTDKLFPDVPSIKEKATCEKFETFDTKRAMKGGMQSDSVLCPKPKPQPRRIILNSSNSFSFAPLRDQIIGIWFI